MIKIEFNKDFATKKKGEVWDCSNPMLARDLIDRKVAKEYVKKAGRPKNNK